MKKLLCASLAIVLTAASFSSSRAQGSGMALQNWKDILVGPVITGGVGINAGPVDTGWKVGMRPAFTVGAMVIYPWSPEMAFDLTVGYDARGVNFHYETSEDTGSNVSLSYLVIRPEVRIMGFIVGLGLGLPMGISATRIEGGPETTLNTSDMAFLFEGRVGADIPVWSSDANQIHLILGGSYAFTKILNPDKIYGGADAKNNGPVATAEIGLSYLFDLSPH